MPMGPKYQWNHLHTSLYGVVEGDEKGKPITEEVGQVSQRKRHLLPAWPWEHLMNTQAVTYLNDLQVSSQLKYLDPIFEI